MPKYCKNDVIVVPLPAASPIAVRKTLAQPKTEKALKVINVQRKAEKASKVINQQRRGPAAAAGYVDEGRKLLDEGNFQAALDAFEHAALLDSRRLGSSPFLGNVFFKIGEGLAKEIMGSEFVSLPLAIFQSKCRNAKLDRIATAYSNAIQFGFREDSALTTDRELWRLMVSHLHRAAVFIAQGDLESALEDIKNATSVFKKVDGNGGAKVQEAYMGYYFNVSVLYKAMSAKVAGKKEHYMRIADQHWACYEELRGL